MYLAAPAAAPSRSQRARHPNPRGVSLIESLTVMAVVAIAAGTAVPSLSSLKTQRHLDGLAAQLETDLQFARSEAVRMHRHTRLDIAATCYVVHTGAAGQCRCDDAATTCEPGARALRHASLAGTGVQLQSASRSLAFDAQRGTVTPTATLRLVAPDGRAVHQIVNVVGRIRSCSPQGQVSGYRAC